MQLLIFSPEIYDICLFPMPAFTSSINVSDSERAERVSSSINVSILCPRSRLLGSKFIRGKFILPEVLLYFTESIYTNYRYSSNVEANHGHFLPGPFQLTLYNH
jgi:hypothetical protein